MTREQYEKLKEMFAAMMRLNSENYGIKIKAIDDMVKLTKELDKLMGFGE